MIGRNGERRMPRTSSSRRSPAQRLKVDDYREVAGEYYGTPKELWGLALPAQEGSPRAVATAALLANTTLLGLDPKLRDLDLRKVVPAIGGSHVIFSQTYYGIPIHRAYVTVHMDDKNRVYLIKNRAVPEELLPPVRQVQITDAEARRLARRSVKGRNLRVLSSEPMWFPRKKTLRFAYKLRVRRATPSAEWIIFIDAITGSVLSKYDNLAMATATARIFNPNPVVALGDWRPLLKRRKPVRRVPLIAYETVRLPGLGTSGCLDGRWVTTRPTKNRIRARSLKFEFASHEPGFEEVMAYYHVDQAIEYLRSLGYKGSRRIFSDRVPINARATKADDSWYSPATRRLEFGTGSVDDAEDGETILHEFGHALQDAICPDFGQSNEAAAMGEGFGDYLAASYFAAKKTGQKRKRLIPAVMTWDAILFKDPNPSKPPCLRRLDSRRTFKSFEDGEELEHDNGQIWSATLWDIWKAVGRDVADRIIIESHFQLDGFTTFARGARAILDADRHLFRGTHVTALRRIFRSRRIGPM
jgi:hypothetical protein